MRLIVEAKRLQGHVKYRNIKSIRAFCNGSASFSKYEYPHRKEAPIIERTLASNIDASTSNYKTKTAPLSDNNFDDGSLSLKEINKKLLLQKQSMFRSLSPNVRSLSSPLWKANIVEEKELSLEEPVVEMTTLSNGLICISQETSNQQCVSSIGLFFDMGSRNETATETGLSHLMEVSAFYSTPSTESVQEEIMKLGGACYCSLNRDQAMYCLDILRDKVHDGMKFLQESILEPKFTDEEVNISKQLMGYQWDDSIPNEMKLSECIMLAAYEGSSLGKWHFCPPNEIGSSVSAETIHKYRSQYLIPNQMVLSSTGLSHEELVQIGNQYFGHLIPAKAPPVKEAIYTGGDYRLTIPADKNLDGFTRIALGFEVPRGWHNPDLIPFCVLQTLLGGGNAFSAGGPGKGMYSRLYQEVLNRYQWVESAEAFTTFHSDSGLFGIQGSCVPSKSKDLVHVFMEHLYKCTSPLKNHQELIRAKNMVKCNVLTQLESRLIIMEDLGRQMLTYGKRESILEMCSKIDAVTADDIQRISVDLLNHAQSGQGITLAVVGDKIDSVPTIQDIQKWF